MRALFSRYPLLIVLLLCGYAFLYLPIFSLIIYSFNESRLVTVWGGFSTKWYGELVNNAPLLNAAWLSIKIAALNATLAIVLGTFAALAIVRMRGTRGHKSLGIMVTAPLVMPEIIIGLSLLLLFVALEDLTGWPEGRGQVTILIAHVTFSMAYVTVIVQSRLAHMDRSIEEAAMDLGARPLKVFFTITLPMIAPALAAGNCVVLKPAEQTPASILVLMEIIGDLLPAGVLNIVNGFGKEAGEALATSKRIAKIAFTGSTPVGSHILKCAAENIIPSTVELGGKSPNIFFNDVMEKDDAFLSKAIEGAVLAYFNQGEVCTCP